MTGFLLNHKRGLGLMPEVAHEATVPFGEAIALETAARSLFPNVAAAFLANGTAPNAFPLAVWREVRDFAQGTVRVQFNLLGGRSDQTAGIVIGLQATGEYLFVRYNTKDGNVAIWAYADGQRQVPAHGSAHKQLALNA